MKLTKAFLPLFLLMATISCGRGGSSSSDSVSSDSLAESGTEVTASRILLCSDSIWPEGGRGVAVGLPLAQLPDEIEGLYNDKEESDSETGRQIHFKLAEEYIFTVLDFGEQRVDLIMANTDKVEVAPSEGFPAERLSLSSPFLSVLSLPGAEPEWVDYEDTGMWYWRWNNLWFAPDQSHLSKALSQHLYNEETLPSRDDFDEEVVIGYIATGIPF